MDKSLIQKRIKEMLEKNRKPIEFVKELHNMLESESEKKCKSEGTR